GTEALPGGAGKAHMNGVVRETFMAVPFRHLAGKHAAACAVSIADGGLQAYRSAAVESGLRLRNQFAIKDVLDFVILDLAPVDRGVFGGRGFRKQLREVESLGLPVLDQLAAVKHLHLANHFVERAEAKLGHEFANFLGNEEEIID